MAKNVASSEMNLRDFVVNLHALCEAFLEGQSATNPAASGDDDKKAARKAELDAMGIRALRALAAKAGFDPADIKDADKDDLVSGLLDEDFPDDEDSDEDEAPSKSKGAAAKKGKAAPAPADDEDDEDEDDDEEEEEYEREDLLKLSLKELKAIAITRGAGKADLAGLDKDSVADLILGEDGDEEDDEDEEDEEAYTEEDFQNMSLAELKALAKENEIDVPKGIKKPALIELILEEVGEDDE